ncbi:cysteine--tRNA ligase [Asticcacaulis excentricus]|uniref:Cysteine--tRNA ligase n=1 Tax=Asticcacaulis excentricus TaxID=78587 RepID=A0A3G9FXB6_9CAUL|nr:cysteine--tRNA ligase [Asticcacaulis excentricus]BBF79700.1 cysteinyl-tRNA synthetase [Asticcacaulis excentricus]
MKLRLSDTLKRQKVDFVPKNPQRVTMYVCGPTVYNYAHIGNARPVVVFDVLFRLLRHLYGEEAVIYARNITDVDDKINQKALAEGVDIDVITSKFADIYNADMRALNALEPTIQPRVTQNMNAIVAQIEALIRNGHAYAAEGHVLFDVESYKAYGALSNRSLDDMIAGARVEVAPYKKNPQDFVLWKPSKPGEPKWPSPWGEGRPGWHIECSAMIEANLGLPIDIHGGGHDLIFPHHENEIAQGVCAQHGHSHQEESYARYWMHNGFLTMDAEKMSKSLGNVLLVHDLIKEFPGEVIRLALLSAHYRAPLDWNNDLLVQTRKTLDRLYGTLREAKRVIEAHPLPDGWEIKRHTLDGKYVEPRLDRMVDILCDDINTPQAIADLFMLRDMLRGEFEASPLEERGFHTKKYMDLMVNAGALLGILQTDPEEWFKGGADDDLSAKVEALLEARKTARAEKNWAEADRIRNELTALNVEVMDGPAGATWKLKA